MGLLEYQKQIEEWRRKYNVKPFVDSMNLTEVHVSCRRCGRIRPRMHRHHIRNDLFFAQLLPDIYAARYCEFHKDDVHRLCDDCHENIHNYWRPIVDRMWRDYPGPGQLTVGWCESWREGFYQVYMQWLETPYRKRK